MKVESNTYIKLTPDELDKLSLCLESISTKPDGTEGKPSKHQLISGLIDGAYGRALINLQQENLIPAKEFAQRVEILPPYMQAHVMKNI